MPVSINCKRCGKEFFVKPSHVKTRVYCSKKCMSESYKGDRRTLNCAFCGKEFEVPDRPSRANARFCSTYCRGKASEGENHWNYQHGQKWLPEKKKKYQMAYYQKNKESATIRAFLHKPRTRTGKRVKNDYTYEEWLALIELHGNKCYYCGVDLTSEEGHQKLTRDHLIPLSRGGTDKISNVVPACKSCNSSKRDKTIEEWKRVTVIETAPTGVKGVE